MATVTSSASRECCRYRGAPLPEPSFEQRAVAVLTAARPPYRGVSEELARKEREVGILFAAVPPAEARALQFRLTACRADDALAVAFARLSRDRRARLLAVLSFVRRPSIAQGER